MISIPEFYTVLMTAVMLLLQIAKCSKHCEADINCRLPECFCGGRTAPGKLGPSVIPQMILFSFDDAVTAEMNEMYNQLFSPQRLNPNGCPISMTLFVSHNFTDYRVLRSLYKRGMEVAVHSVTHRTPTTFWRKGSYGDIRFEIVEQRKIISEKAGIPIKNIIGWRSPFLQPSGDKQYEILTDEKFEYDSTMTVTLDGGFSSKLWPQTLDYGWNLDCNVQPCPNKRYQGFWEIPVLMLEKPDSKYGCLYADSCRPNDMEASFKLFWQNFHNHYTTNRAPLFYTMHASWLREEHNKKALDYFILTLLHYYEDVFFVTYQQLLKWMRDPTELSEIRRFKPWGCSDRALLTDPFLQKDDPVLDNGSRSSFYSINLMGVFLIHIVFYLTFHYAL